MATLSDGNPKQTIRMVVAAAITTLAVVMLLALSGCKTTKVVYVPQHPSSGHTKEAKPLRQRLGFGRIKVSTPATSASRK